MKFFNEIWLKVGEHKLPFHFWNKIFKKIILFKYGSQNKFCDIAQ